MIILDSEPYSLEALRARVVGGWQPDYLFFWGHTARHAWVGRECLSQWYPAIFSLDERTFPTAEHFMMYSKAMLFGDRQAAERILAARHPGEAKNLGRSVAGFDEQLWEQQRFEIVLAGSRAKFSQNPPLADFLLNTKRRVLVEASPLDAIWGIGLSEREHAALDPERWRGLNLLGFALMCARRTLAGEAGA